MLENCYAGLSNLMYSLALQARITGNASEIPGSYSISVNLVANAPEVSYNGMVVSALVRYTVPEPACSLGSASSLSLPFGTLNSDEFGSTQRIADISLNCTGTKNVSARLSPTQGIVSASAGLSATTLDGLLMAATWADNGTAVDFATPRSFAMVKGANLIRLGFRPQLQAGAYPAGEFAGQYTLSLDYR
ncbi:MAG: fimbrial protein [Pseudomonas orientalis]|nr:fimbrial protein [Pseudomonas orientalis]